MRLRWVLWRWMLLPVLSLVFVGQAAAEGVYRCTQADGGVRFQGTPCAGVADRERLPRLAKQQMAVSEADKRFIWHLNKAGQRGSLYLFGSIHFGTPEMYPLPRSVADAFVASDTLVVEADIARADPQALAMTVARYGTYQDGSTLQQHIAEDTWQQLSQVAAELGMAPSLLQGQKPWLASMTLSALMLNKLGYQEELGIDRHLLLRAGGREVIELEGLEFQLRLFEQLTEAEQEAMLLASLEEMDQGKAFFERLFTAWQAGDAAGLEAVFNEGFDDDPVSQRLFEVIMLARNRRMVQRLEGLAADGRRHFVVVGAGHLPGKEGLLALLAARGYQVRQLKD